MPDVAVPFRVEYMGDPPMPYIVQDGGDHAKPFDRHAMRSWLVPAECRDEFLALWNVCNVQADVVKTLREELAGKEADAAGKGKRR